MDFVFRTTLTSLEIGPYAKFVGGIFRTSDPVIADKVRRSIVGKPTVWEHSALMEEAREAMESIEKPEPPVEPVKRKRGRPPKSDVVSGMRKVKIEEEKQ
jgi:hypothetical protein